MGIELCLHPNAMCCASGHVCSRSMLVIVLGYQLFTIGSLMIYYATLVCETCAVAQFQSLSPVLIMPFQRWRGCSRAMRSKLCCLRFDCQRGRRSKQFDQVNYIALVTFMSRTAAIAR